MILVLFNILVPLIECNDIFIFVVADDRRAKRVVETESCTMVCFTGGLHHNVDMKMCVRQGDVLGPSHFGTWLRCPASSLTMHHPDVKETQINNEKGTQLSRSTEDRTQYILQVPYDQYRISHIGVIPVTRNATITLNPFDLGIYRITSACFMYSQQRLYFASQYSVYYTPLTNPNPTLIVVLKTRFILATDEKRQLLITSSKIGFWYCLYTVSPEGKNRTKVHCVKREVNDVKTDSWRSRVFLASGTYISCVTYGGQNFTNLVKAKVLMTFFYDKVRDELDYLQESKLMILSLTTGKTNSISFSFPFSSFPISFLRFENQLHVGFFDSLYIKFDLKTGETTKRKARYGNRFIKYLLCGVGQ